MLTKLQAVVTVVGILLTTFTYGQQVPNTLAYQAIARDMNGNALSNQTVDIEVRILNENGTAVYEELELVTTDQQGRFVYTIGQANEDTFSEIDWGTGPHSLIVFVDRELITLEPFSTVPYAFAANTALDDGDRDPTNELQNLIFDSDNGTLSLSNTSSSAIPLYEGINLGPIRDSSGVRGSVVTFGENGNINLALSNIAGRPNSGAISVRGSEGNTGILLFTDSKDDGQIQIRDKGDNIKVAGFVRNNGSGSLILDGENGNLNIVLGNLADQPNNGFIGVRDEEGDTQAGIYVDEEGQGIVFADEVRGFTQDPTNTNRLVAYSMVEGPEVGAYDRGTATLEKGEIFVPYAQHFKIVSNTEKVTIQITPLEWDTYGVAVTRKTSEGFYVKELKGGTGNFQFDWEIKAVRRGHETYQVFQSQSEVTKLTTTKVAKMAKPVLSEIKEQILQPKQALSNLQKQE